MSAATAGPAPLDDLMLAMDVADTVGHDHELAALTRDSGEPQLIARLRDLYHRQGIKVSDDVLRDGVAALGQSRFTYVPPRSGIGVMLARLYIARGRWLPITTSLILIVAISLGGYFLIYEPYRARQIEAAEIELTQTLPAQMDTLYQTIYEETKVQAAASQAETLRTEGKAAAAAGDRRGAEAAVSGLLQIRDRLQQEYQLRIASRPGEKPGFWRFPRTNSDDTNYFIIVAAVDGDGKAIAFPVVNQEDGKVETVARWGLRVPESVYRSIEADYDQDGVLQRSLIGSKAFGFLDIDFAVQVLGGTLTRW